MARTDYKNYIPPATGRRFSMTNNADGTVSLTDVTQYTQTGDIWGAGDANDFGTEINKNAADIATKADKSVAKKVAFTVSGWTGNAAPYTQTVAVEGIVPSTNAVLDYEHAGTAVEEKARRKAWSSISFFTAGNGTIKATCLERLPESDIAIEIMIVG